MQPRRAPFRSYDLQRRRGEAHATRAIPLRHPEPRLARRDHARVEVDLRREAERVVERVEEALPAHHVAGLLVLVRAYLSGVPPVTLDSVGGAGHFSADEFANATRAARSLCEIDGAKLRTALVPTQLARIVELGPAAGDCLSAYDSILIGGAAAAPGLIAHARALGANITTTYGMTETCGGCVYDGTPLPGVSVRIANPNNDGIGTIELGSPSIARGYRLRPDLTEASFRHGLHRTSDLGRIDDQGRLVVAGRIDDVVHVGGVNVSVAAVEAAVVDHPLVAQAAVVASADSQWGSRITAFIVASTVNDLTPEQLTRSVIERAASAMALSPDEHLRSNTKPGMSGLNPAAWTVRRPRL